MGFFFGGHCCCCHVKYVMLTSESKNLTKNKNKKTFNLESFFDQYPLSRFTVFGTGLPVNCSNQFSSPSISKFKFESIFDRFYQFS
jgi:hypothetical protein